MTTTVNIESLTYPLTDVIPDSANRRDIKAMTALLAVVRPGDALTVAFRSPRYGVFSVHGIAVRSASTNTLMVGSLFIETNGKPDKNVVSISSSKAMITADDPEDRDPDREQLQSVVDDLEHGDLVEATFVQHPHGRFSIIGVATQTADDVIIVVGSWFIAQDGHAAPRLHALTRIAPAGHHGLRLPAKIASWDEDTAVSGAGQP